MALVTRNPGDGIRSLDIDQIVQLLTGAMPDQAVSIGQSLLVQGRTLSVKSLVSPNPSLTAVVGGTGSTTHTYTIAASNADGDAVVSPTPLIVTTCPASLTSGNYVTINWPPAFGALNYKIYRDNQLIATQAAVQGQTTNYTYNDIGTAGGAAATGTTDAGIGGFLSLLGAKGGATKQAGGAFFSAHASGTTGPGTTVGTKINIDTYDVDPSGGAQSGVTGWRIPVSGLYLGWMQAIITYAANQWYMGDMRLTGPTTVIFSSSAFASTTGFNIVSVGIGMFHATVGQVLAQYCDASSPTCTVSSGTGVNMGAMLVSAD